MLLMRAIAAYAASFLLCHTLMLRASDVAIFHASASEDAMLPCDALSSLILIRY